MVKKRKPAATKSPAPRRVSQRGKKADNDEANAAQSDTSASEPSSASTDHKGSPIPSKSSTIMDIAAIKASEFPIVALHKKFGKYRCLVNEDGCVKKFDLGSDSENSSSMDIKAVDTSESESNSASEIHIDLTSNTQSPMDTRQIDNSSPVIEINEPIEINESRPNSPVVCNLDSYSIVDEILPVPVVAESIPVPIVDGSEPTPVVVESISVQVKEENVPIPIEESEPRPVIEECVPIPFPEVNILDQSKINKPENCISDISLSMETDNMEDDDEIITVVQIVDDGDECLDITFDINVKSPKTGGTEETEKSLEPLRKSLIDFQEHFERLKIQTPPVISLLDSPDINNTSNLESCLTSDLNKESYEGLLRPDPSLTPSSTISDDSNSSRILTEQNDSAESSPTAVRRSSRIKTISTLKQKTKGYGLVKTPLKKALLTQAKMKLEELGSDSSDKMLDLPVNVSTSPTFPVPLEMPVKVKSRWRRSSELEMGSNSPTVSPLASPGLPRLPSVVELKEEVQTENVTTKEDCERIINDRMKQYEHVDENVYLCDRMVSKDAKKMICDCFLTKEEIERGELGCGEDCLNRLLMIECNSRCPVGERCTNRRIQKLENTPLSVFYADKKGCGVSAPADIASGEFLMEYVGEVLDYDLFYKRAMAYSEDNNLHHYFMSLKGDTVIDATVKGNISRFINHSCDPNAETQKWTVNGELRIGFFSKRDIRFGEEITFDYQFQRFGKVAQRCYCGAENCRRWIGAEPDSEDEEDEEEDDVSTSKSASTELSLEQVEGSEGIKPAPKRRPKRERKYVPPAPELVQDADIEEDLEALSRTGIKNQSHTLSLSRSMVRAKGCRAQTSLLRLLRDADLPCRRLFLDYRGLRLLAPWCADAPLVFRWEMLQTVDRLPIPNKTIIQESRFFTIVERWLSSTAEHDTAETTGLSSDNKPEQDPLEKLKEATILAEKVKDLSKQLLERWASLKEIFKIPKKERIQQMKEHERQANVERRAADSSGSSRERDRRDDRERDRERIRDRERERDRDRERERERERERDRERERHKDREREKELEREKDRDRDRRKRRTSPEGRRSIRLGERVLASVPPLSKEERRRAFAEAAEAAEICRRNEPSQHAWPPMWPPDVNQMMPPNMMGGPPSMQPIGNMPTMPPMPSMPSMMNAPPGMLLGGGMMNMMPDQSEWGPGGPPQRFCPPFAGPQQFCMPPNYIRMGYPMGGYMGMPGFAQMPPPMGAMPPQPPDMTMQQPMHIPQIKLEPDLQPIPAPEDVVLPSLWRSAVDARGRTYYYHVKHRQPRWAPPTPPPPQQEESSEEEEEILQAPAPRRQPKMVEGVDGVIEVIKENKHNGLIPDHALVNKPRKRRPGLVHERPISPRTEEDKLAGRLEVKRYKETKEKLRKKREKFLKKMKIYQKQMSKRGKKKHDLSAHEIKMLGLAAEMDSESDSSSDSSPELILMPEPVAVPEVSADETRRIKDHFRCSMARVMVQYLNPYRHSSAVVGKITSTSDFKHLAKKLTHFVMVKELKHCTSIKELVCNDSVKNKAKEFVKKYMSKYGAVYQRPPEEAD